MEDIATGIYSLTLMRLFQKWLCKDTVYHSHNAPHSTNKVFQIKWMLGRSSFQQIYREVREIIHHPLVLLITLIDRTTQPKLRVSDQLRCLKHCLVEQVCKRINHINNRWLTLSKKRNQMQVQAVVVLTSLQSQLTIAPALINHLEEATLQQLSNSILQVMLEEIQCPLKMSLSDLTWPILRQTHLELL